MPKQPILATGGAPARKKAPRRAAAKAPEPSPPPPAPQDLFPIVGVGASAGGLDAFRQLLSALPGEPQVALVLVPHLEPSHESHLTELLARATPMPVCEATDGLRLEPNRVYVLPPAFFISIEAGALRLTPRAGQHLPIDFFLRSLAEGHRERAVGVILSGTGTDGTLGLQAVRAAGGLGFAQEPSSAGYGGMPQSAIAAGNVDFVLPAEGIARELVRLGQHLPVRPAELPLGPAQEKAADREGWNEILRLLHGATGTDFSLYKRATLGRRIARRMTALDVATLAGYARRLADDPGEIRTLHQELLISVTSFFRDPATTRILCDKLIARLCDESSPPFSAIRIWVAGCATGEEVYSLAISLLERVGELAPHVPAFQFFATDLSESTVARARAGIYPESISQQVSAERLERFFTQGEGHYQISKTLRDLCVFARHDVAKDPPFSRIDVISCCNLLIYFEPRLQERVLATFHYALNPGGFLVLGPSESAAAAPALFEALDEKHKIYGKKPTAGFPGLHLGARPPVIGGAPRAPHGPAEPAVRGRPWVPKEADQLLLARYVPAGVIVDERLDILEFRGDTQPYLQHAGGEATLNLMKMVRKELYVDVRQAIDEVRKGAAPARREGLRLRHEGRSRTVAVEVIPILGLAESEHCLLVLFEGPAAGHGSQSIQPARRSSGRSSPGAPSPVVEEGQESTGGPDRDVARLERELTEMTQYLRTVLQEHEVAYEQMQASHEETLSANEEFQSLNEELETAKEEVQSVNEELATLNQELQDRNLLLGRLNDDLLNLLDSISTPILMVDSGLCLRRFTPAAEALFGLRPADVGRALGSVRTSLATDLESEARKVVENDTLLEREVSSADGLSFLLRIRPYRTHDKKIDGAVLVLFDISAVRQSSEQVRRALEETGAEREALLALEQRARERAELADHIKDEFLATTSHELRGPLQAMAGWVHVLQSEGDAARLARGLAALDRGVQAQTRLIEDLLDHSRIVAGQLHLRPRAIHLTAVAELALEAVRLGAEAKDLRLELRHDDPAAETLHILGDPDRLQQVVLNLLSNAIKFTPAGGRIEVGIGRQGDRLQLTVTDTGQGIRPDFMPHVFERFRQADAAPSRQQQGLGLGLAIVRQLVELQQGTVTAESAGEGRGAKLTVSFPLLVVEPHDAAPPDPAAAVAGALATTRLDGLRVLVVEDEANTREALALLLEHYGAQVIVAASSAEAIGLLEGPLPDLLVSDIGMPGEDGYELIRQVRRRSAERGGRLPALALTAYADPEDGQRAVDAGFQMHLAKPATPAELLRKVAQLAGRGEARLPIPDSAPLHPGYTG